MREAQHARREVSRRRMLGGAGGVVGAALVAGGAAAMGERPGGDLMANGLVPFRQGRHQAGITTAAQDRVAFAAFDVVDAGNLRPMLAAWTGAVERLAVGREATHHAPESDADSTTDTGEVLGVGTGRLTVTVGYGATLFDRVLSAARRPRQLRPLPAFPHDAIDPAISGGDLAIQACSDDPQVAFHLVHNLARLGAGVVRLRWLQSGFGRTSSTAPTQQTPRNLMGFKDGTRNITADQPTELRSFVWAGAGSTGQGWMDGGSYLVARKIRMRLEKWDRDGLDDQEDTFGRRKVSGAPFGAAREFDTPDLAATTAGGTPVIPATAHIRLASRESNGGVQILRRGYSYSDGVDPDGALDAGLFFLAYMRDPAQFVRLQSRLAAADDLNEYTQHVSSALFAVPRGLAEGEDWGSQLFDSQPSGSRSVGAASG